MKDINSQFADIVNFCLDDVDEIGNDILLEEILSGPTIYTDQMPTMVFPFGYMIISSTFAFFEEEEEE